MDDNFDTPGLLEKISLVVAASFIPVSLVCAIIWPVAGLPLWGKGLFTGLFFLAVYASFRKRRRDDAARSRQTASAASGPQAPTAGGSDDNPPHQVGREEGLPGGDQA